MDKETQLSNNILVYPISRLFRKSSSRTSDGKRTPEIGKWRDQRKTSQDSEWNLKDENLADVT